MARNIYLSVIYIIEYHSEKWKKAEADYFSEIDAVLLPYYLVEVFYLFIEDYGDSPEPF